MTFPHDLTDEDLLDELASSDDPDEIVTLRAVCAQRGLHSAALNMTPGDRRKLAEEQGYVR